MANYPQRIGEPECRDFLRTGRCKYGASCKYHHPIGGASAINPNEPPFPIRPGEPTCQYYIKNGTCKFGQTCKFHHPPEILLSKGSTATNFVCTIVGNQNSSPTLFSKKHAQPAPAATSVEAQHVSKDSRQREKVDMVLPQRPGEPDCIYYLRNGKCKYGGTCKYHHPPRISDGKNTIGVVAPSTRNNNIQVSPSFRRQRSCSDSLIDGHDLQTYLFSGVLPQQASAIQSSASYVQDASIHRSLPGSSSHLSTINNSFQQYPPPPHSALNDPNMTNTINAIGGSILQLNNVPSQKMGSPSMSSTTVASSYDTASLETLQPLPPSRVSGGPTSVIGSPTQDRMQSRIGSYSDLNNLNLPQAAIGNGQQHHYLSRTNSKEDMVYGLPIETSHLSTNIPTKFPSGSSSRILQHQQHFPSHSLHLNPHATVVQSQPSDPSSLASQSPTSAEHVSVNGDSSSQFETTNNNDNTTSSGAFNQKASNPSVDDGLSMMTDALLSMMDTPSAQATSSSENDLNIHDSDSNFLHERMIRSNFSRRRNVPRKNSLPESMLSENVDRLLNLAVNNITSTSHGNNGTTNIKQEQEQQHLSQFSPPVNVHLKREASFIGGEKSRMVSSMHSSAAPLHQQHQQQHQQPQYQQQLNGASIQNHYRVATGRPPTHFYMPSS